MNLESQVGGYRAAELANVEQVYSSVARLIGAGDINSNNDDGAENAKQYNAREEIAMVESATVGWTRAFYSMLETKERELSKTDKSSTNKELVILVSEAEYAANLVAAVKFARDHTQNSRFSWRVFPIPSSTVKGEGGVSISSGVVDLDAFQSILKGTYAIGDSELLDPSSIVMVCITQIPTNSGIINSVNEIGAMIDTYNNCREGESNGEKLPQILYLVDACQSVGQVVVDVNDMKCHALAATGRKYLRGPRGTGFLYIQKHIPNVLEPSHVDHAAAPVVRVMEQPLCRHGLEEESDFGLCYTYKPGAARFEFWEANIATRLGLGAAIDVLLSLGPDIIEAKCRLGGNLLRQRLRLMKDVHVYHDDSSSCGIVTFFVDYVDATTIKARMQDGLCEEDPKCCYHLSAVPATSTPLDSSRTGLGERNLLRASLSYFNTEDEIDSFCKALESVISGEGEKYLSAPSMAEDTPSTMQADFFAQQLDVCKQIISDDDLRSGFESNNRSNERFKEHPRCTKRFGEVLLHARNGAGSHTEYQYAVQNARSIVHYVDACRKRSKPSSPIREGLTADIVAALTSHSLRNFRIQQINADVSISSSHESNHRTKLDFTREEADIEIVGRLYYSAIKSTEQYIKEVGLTVDHGGFTALLALCRAASSSISAETVPDGLESSSLTRESAGDTFMISKDEAQLDAALSKHFNGITAPGCRFLFSPQHGIDKDHNVVGRAKRLVVAFSSLGNGLVRHEFGGSLAKINKQLQAQGEEVFDALFVADPSQSWYQKDSHGNFDGFLEYEQRIRTSSEPYDQVSLVGDSMGGSAALLFSHLATESVVAFSPQIELVGDVHVGRCDMTNTIRVRYRRRLLSSVEEAVTRRVKIFVHRGMEEADIRHTNMLTNHLSEKASEGCCDPLDGHLMIVEHHDCQHHQIAVHLKEKGQLAQTLFQNIIE